MPFHNEGIHQRWNEILDKRNSMYNIYAIEKKCGYMVKCFSQRINN